MCREGFEAEGLVARCTPNHIFIEHFGYERRRCSVAPSRLLAHLAHLVILLDVLVVELHAQAVGAIELSAFWVVTFDRTIDDFCKVEFSQN